MADNNAKAQSLTARVLTIATVWAVIALVVIAVLISTLYRNNAERAFREVLLARLYNLINSVSVGADGQLGGEVQLGDLGFSQPDSGLYWIADLVDGDDTDRLTSPSMGTLRIDVPSANEFPFNARYERFYPTIDSNGHEIVVAETEIVLEGDTIARFRVTGSQAAVDGDVAAFSHRLYLYLGLFGVLSVFVNGFAILYGLRPLDAVKRALEDIRTGKTETLTGLFPREIAPLAAEVNALIDNNKRIVERARMQVGNLAHSLKTPIAVLLNETRGMKPEQATLVSEQARAMQQQVQHYLDRARIAAQQNSLLVRTDTAEVLERLTRVMRRLNPETEFDLALPEGTPKLAMEQHDVEEILGNLLENAAKWANGKVLITAEAPEKATSGSGQRPLMDILIDDDGPGMPEDQLEEALKRGKRLDESKPGTGLGLSIVSEIAGEYKGAFKLERSALGGLRARLSLPVAVR